jgi:hypothetical protein
MSLTKLTLALIEAPGSAGKLEQVVQQGHQVVQNANPLMGAQCCKGDQYMKQVESVAPEAAAAQVRSS